MLSVTSGLRFLDTESACSVPFFSCYWLGADDTEAIGDNGTTGQKEPESLNHCMKQSHPQLGTLMALTE